jgi:hypothetical protein
LEIDPVRERFYTKNKCFEVLLDEAKAKQEEDEKRQHEQAMRDYESKMCEDDEKETSDARPESPYFRRRC